MVMPPDSAPNPGNRSMLLCHHMELLLYKLISTPIIMGLATWVSRKLGIGVGGWIAGLPLTSGPVSLFLALQHNPQFAVDAALGTMSGSASTSAFCVMYALSARRVRWPFALIFGFAGFAFMTLVWKVVAIPLLPLYVTTIAVIIAALRIAPRPITAASAVTQPNWDIPLRMFLATAFVLALTSASDMIGPTWSGLLSPIPIYATLMASFAHVQQGPDGALRVLRGVLLGTFAFATFFLIIGGLVTSLPLGLVYGLAASTAMGINAAVFHLARR